MPQGIDDFPKPNPTAAPAAPSTEESMDEPTRNFRRLTAERLIKQFTGAVCTAAISKPPQRPAPRCWP